MVVFIVDAGWLGRWIELEMIEVVGWLRLGWTKSETLEVVPSSIISCHLLVIAQCHQT